MHGALVNVGRFITHTKPLQQASWKASYEFLHRTRHTYVRLANINAHTFFKLLYGILRNWETLICDIKPHCYHQFDASGTPNQMRYWRVSWKTSDESLGRDETYYVRLAIVKCSHFLKPLCNSLNPLFAFFCTLYKVPAVVVYKRSLRKLIRRLFASIVAY